MAYVLFGAAERCNDGRNGNAQRDRCRCHDQAHRDAKKGSAQAAEIAASRPSKAAPTAPIREATPAKMVGKLDSRPPLRP